MCGYYATPREKATPEGYTHDWTAFVKGDHETDLEEEGSDLKYVVRKVVFQLHKDFEPNATRGNGKYCCYYYTIVQNYNWVA